MLDVIVEILKEVVEILEEEQVLPSRSGYYGKLTITVEKPLSSKANSLVIRGLTNEENLVFPLFKEVNIGMA